MLNISGFWIPPRVQTKWVIILSAPSNWADEKIFMLVSAVCTSSGQNKPPATMISENIWKKGLIWQLYFKMTGIFETMENPAINFNFLAQTLVLANDCFHMLRNIE